MNNDLLRKLRIRGLILEILHTEPHGPIELSDLQARLYLFGYAMLLPDIYPHIRYLSDRGYIKIEKKAGGSIMLISITSNGDDLVMCIVPEDEGVLIPRCERPHGQ